ncbi:hypothetical protein H072_2402 [Dactylellina haptotyla CBS 200.50]|uniref:Nephrocystin 3-like N-terminal domain-containing protein n=1 Tax=Dactylellina haptotyla (strain CBS 200.50) TaxID=1284197 RepID=S8C7H1_DACHA|nr:hypothetical protein H072_2402 [Dactylellina haptotyla CBS 200.50]
MAPGVVMDSYVNGHSHSEIEDEKVVLPNGHSKPSFDQDRTVIKSNGFSSLLDRYNESPSETSSRVALNFKPMAYEPCIEYANGSRSPESLEVSIKRVIEETLTVVHGCKKQLGSQRDNPFAGAITLQGLTDFIHAQRLRDMPDKGSTWDKILRWALIYARRIDEFATTIEPYYRISATMARDIWSCCRSLLQLGCRDLHVMGMLKSVFEQFYRIGESLDSLREHRRLFGTSKMMQKIIAQMFSEIVKLTIQTTTYYKRQNTITYQCIEDYTISFTDVITSLDFHRKSFESEVWSCCLEASQEIKEHSVSVDTIQTWLLTSHKEFTIATEAEGTCTWFDKHLMDFEEANDEIFAIYGRAGIGKSVLAKWIMSRLTTHQKGITLFYSMDGNSKSSTSSLNLVRSLVSQLLGRRIGDVKLYKHLLDVYESAIAYSSGDLLEKQLWQIFEKAAKATWQLTIIIDGLDHIEGGFPAADAITSLISNIASENGENTLKCILLCKQFKERFSCSVKTYKITEEDVCEDIDIYVDLTISSWSKFSSLTRESKRQIIKTVITQSKGSFTWASLTLQLIKREKTLDGINVVLGKPARDINELTERVLVSLDWKDSDTRRILSWLLFSKQELTVAALKELLELDIGKKPCRNTRFTGIHDDLSRACGSVVIIDNGMVRFSSPTIRARLLEIVRSNKFITVEDCQKEITFCCWGYVSVCEFDSGVRSVSQDILSAEYLQSLFQHHHLLEYSTKHWVKHYRRSVLYSNGTITADDHCKALFPRSSFFCQIERTLWVDRKVEEKHIKKYFDFSVEIRRKLVGKSHSCVIQSVLNLAYVFETFTKSTKYIDLYHECWELSRACYGDQHVIVMGCATKYIEIIEKFEKKTYGEEVYKWTYEYCKHVHGESHEETIKYAICLGQLYIRKEKKEVAVTIFRDIWHVCSGKLGFEHSTTVTVCEHLVQVLEETEQFTEIITIRKKCTSVFSSELKIWDIKRVTNQIKLALTYELQGEFEQSEEVLITVIRGITEGFKSCEHHEHIHIHIARIEATLEMSRFYRRHHKHHEAESLLIELWKETMVHVTGLERYSETFMKMIISVAEEMEVLEMTTVMSEVYTCVWTYFKSATTTVRCSEIAILVGRRLATICEHHHHDVVREETILRETFEVTTTTTTTVETVIETTTTLASFYERHEQWTEVVNVCTKTLTSVWAEILNLKVQEICYLPKTCHTEAIHLAWRLALAFESSREIVKAETIYINILTACRKTLRIVDVECFESLKKITCFYETHGKFEKAIKVYVEFFDSCHTKLGITHHHSLEVAYELAKLYVRQGNTRSAEKIYLQIWRGCLVGSHHCHQGSVEAGWLLCEIYEREHRHEEAIKIYQILWGSICDVHVEVTIEETRMLTLYKRFKSILTIESKFDLLYDITVVFEKYCNKTHGETHILTIEAMLELATVIERTETRRTEAVTIYEKIIEISTNVTVTEEVKKTIITTKKHLASCYSHSSTTVVKAEATYVEIWTTCKHTHGVSHTSTLDILEELVVFHMKNKSVKKAIELLETTIIEIFNTERESERLFHCGLTLAKCYRLIGSIEAGSKFSKEIHKFLFTYKPGKCGKDSPFSKWTVRQINGSIVDRKYHIFLYAFEEVLQREEALRSTHLYAYILQNLLTETELYESWTKIVTIDVKCEQKLLYGCRLIAHLKQTHRHEESLHIREQLWTIFHREYTHKHVEVEITIMKELFEKCIVETISTDREIVIVDIAITQIEEYVRRREFTCVSTLSTWTHTHIKVTHNTSASLKLVNILSSSTVTRFCKEETIIKKITEITETIIIDSVSETSTTTVSWHQRSIVEVNKVLILLGSKKNYSRMLTILEELWENRTTQSLWTPSVVSLIGRRLVETYFVLDEKTKAIKLCERICYNYERVWGLLNPSTLEFYDFLSELYITSKKYEKAIAIHERILQQAIGDKKSLPEGSNMGEIVYRQTELLQAAVGRTYAGKQVSVEEKKHRETLLQRIKSFFGDDFEHQKMLEGLKDEKAFAKGHGETFGCWKAPEKWEISGFEDDDETPRGLDSPDVHVSYADGTCGGPGKKGVNGNGYLSPDIMKRGTSYYGKDRKSVLFSTRSFETLFRA